MSSDKDYVITALGDASRLWATLGHGILNEVYWPSTRQPQVRDLTLALHGLISSGWAATTCLEVLPDPHRDVLLIRFALAGPYRLVGSRR